MLKYSIAIVAALSLSTTASLARAKDTAPVYAGVYQIYGQFYCTKTVLTQFVGTMTFHGRKVDIFEWVGAGSVQSFSQNNVSYSVGPGTLTIGNQVYKTTTRLDENGKVRSGAMIYAYQNDIQGNCTASNTLFR